MVVLFYIWLLNYVTKIKSIAIQFIRCKINDSGPSFIFWWWACNLLPMAAWRIPICAIQQYDLYSALGRPSYCSMLYCPNCNAPHTIFWFFFYVTVRISSITLQFRSAIFFALKLRAQLWSSTMKIYSMRLKKMKVLGC